MTKSSFSFSLKRALVVYFSKVDERESIRTEKSLNDNVISNIKIVIKIIIKYKMNSNKGLQKLFVLN